MTIGISFFQRLLLVCWLFQTGFVFILPNLSRYFNRFSIKVVRNETISFCSLKQLILMYRIWTFSIKYESKFRGAAFYVERKISVIERMFCLWSSICSSFSRQKEKNMVVNPKFLSGLQIWRGPWSGTSPVHSFFERLYHYYS